MRLKEIFIDLLNDTLLFEMAYSRKKAIEIVSGYAPTLAEHLVKIIAFEDQRYLSHHSGEINGYFNIMNRVRWNRTRILSKEDFYRLLWDEPLGHGISAVKDILYGLVELRDYQVKRSELSEFQVYEILHKLYLEFCFDLSVGKVKKIQIYLNQLEI